MRTVPEHRYLLVAQSMKVPHLALILSCGVSAVISESCQQFAAIIDDSTVSTSEKVRAVSHLVVPNCMSFLIGGKTENPGYQMMRAKGKILHYIDVIAETIDDKDPSLNEEPIFRSLHQSLISSMSALVEQKDLDTLASTLTLTNRMSSIIDSVAQSVGKPEPLSEILPTGAPVELNAQLSAPIETEAATEMVKAIDQANQVLIVDNVQTISEQAEAIGAAGKVAHTPETRQQLEENKMETIDDRIEPILVEAIEVEMQEEYIVNAIEEHKNRQLDSEMPHSPETIGLMVNGVAFNMPCKRLVILDFESGSIKVDDLSKTCFAELPHTVFKMVFSNPTTVAKLRENIWQSMNSKRLHYLVQNHLLTEVSATKLALIGKDDPSVCSVFDSAQDIARITNLGSLSNECVASAPLWGVLVQQMSNAPNDVLGFIANSHLTFNGNNPLLQENIDALNQAELNAGHWKNTGSKVGGVCDILAEVMLMLPKLAENLPDTCAKVNPGLVVSIQENMLSSYVNKAISSETATLGTFDDKTFRIIAEKLSGAELKRLIENGDHCGELGRTAHLIHKSKLIKALGSCTGIGLDLVTDDQVAQIAKDCEYIEFSTVASIGPRFFQYITEKCLTKLDPEAAALSADSPEIVNLISLMNDKQRAALPAETIVHNLRNLKPEQAENLSDVHMAAIQDDPSAVEQLKELLSKAEIKTNKTG